MTGPFLLVVLFWCVIGYIAWLGRQRREESERLLRRVFAYASELKDGATSTALLLDHFEDLASKASWFSRDELEQMRDDSVRMVALFTVLFHYELSKLPSFRDRLGYTPLQPDDLQPLEHLFQDRYGRPSKGRWYKEDDPPTRALINLLSSLPLSSTFRPR